MKLLILAAVLSLSGCATGIAGYNTYNNASQLTSAGVKAEGWQVLTNMLVAFNRSRGGF